MDSFVSKKKIKNDLGNICQHGHFELFLSGFALLA